MGTATSGGDAFTVAWTVQNQGNSPTETGVLFDQIYLSDTPTFVPPDSGKSVGNQWFLGTVEHDGALGSNGSYTSQATFQPIAIGSRRDLEDMARVLTQHEIRPVIDSVYLFNDAKAAWGHFANRQLFGKVVVRL